MIHRYGSESCCPHWRDSIQVSHKRREVPPRQHHVAGVDQRITVDIVGRGYVGRIDPDTWVIANLHHVGRIDHEVCRRVAHIAWGGPKQKWLGLIPIDIEPLTFDAAIGPRQVDQVLAVVSDILVYRKQRHRSGLPRGQIVVVANEKREIGQVDRSHVHVVGDDEHLVDAPDIVAHVGIARHFADAQCHLV